MGSLRSVLSAVDLDLSPNLWKAGFESKEAGVRVKRGRSSFLPLPLGSFLSFLSFFFLLLSAPELGREGSEGTAESAGRSGGSGTKEPSSESNSSKGPLLRLACSDQDPLHNGSVDM